ncbi:MAG TPA: hypothetical protein PLY93_05275 [Turneriella sp.]|nr:hypothetical protein [Turneriella sp.]
MRQMNKKAMRIYTLNQNKFLALVAFIPLMLLLACRPATERAYQKSFELRSAREVYTAGDTASARYYLNRVSSDTIVKEEAAAFLHRIDERKEHSDDCLADKKAELELNRYPKMRYRHLFQIGVCFEVANNTKQAMGFYNLAESSGGKQPQLYIRRGLLRERLGDIKGASEDFIRADKLNHEYPPALLALALFQVRTGDVASATKTLAAIKDIKPTYAEVIADALKHQKEYAAFPRGIAVGGIIKEEKDGTK